MLANCGANTQRLKCLRAAYNNAYRIMHHIPRTVSIRPHQVNHCVRTFDALLRNNLYRFFYTMCIFIQLFYSFSSNVWCFKQIFIFPQFFKAPVSWRPTALAVGALIRCSRLISIGGSRIFQGGLRDKFIRMWIAVMVSRDLASVSRRISRPAFWSLGLEGLRSHLSSRSRSRRISVLVSSSSSRDFA